MRDDDLNSRQRAWFLDEARGLSILLMVLHHGAYDAAFLLGWPLDFLSAGWFGIIRTFFAGVFVLISGCACRFSRSNLRRGARCAMLLFAFLQPLLDRIPPAFGAGVGLFLFFFCFSVPSGRLGFGPMQIQLPRCLFQNAFTAVLGFPGPGYYSADYFPLIPWLFLFWAGACAGVWLRLGRGPGWLYQRHSPFLAAAGQKSLWIYLVHQPALYLIFLLIRLCF